MLYSESGDKSYTGFTNDLERRLTEHNITGTKGFTLRYRPWVLIHQESLTSKLEAMAMERYLKTGAGREKIKLFIKRFLDNNGTVSATTEKD